MYAFKQEQGSLACDVDKGSSRAQGAQCLRRPFSPCYTTHITLLAGGFYACSISCPGWINGKLRRGGTWPTDCKCHPTSTTAQPYGWESLYVSRKVGLYLVWSGWSALPALPYDPGEQGCPLHAVDPAERYQEANRSLRVTSWFQKHIAF
jgi:hypothetical protein